MRIFFFRVAPSLFFNDVKDDPHSLNNKHIRKGIVFAQHTFTIHFCLRTPWCLHEWLFLLLNDVWTRNHLNRAAAKRALAQSWWILRGKEWRVSAAASMAARASPRKTWYVDNRSVAILIEALYKRCLIPSCILILSYYWHKTRVQPYIPTRLH